MPQILSCTDQRISSRMSEDGTIEFSYDQIYWSQNYNEQIAIADRNITISIPNGMTYRSHDISGNYIINNDAVTTASTWYPYADDVHKRQRVLDFKTIAKLKFSWKSFDKMSKRNWKEYYSLKNSPVSWEKNSNEARQLKQFRSKIKYNIKFKVDLNDEIGTYVTFDVNQKKAIEFANKNNVYMYILTRIKEKIQLNRKESRKLIYDESSEKQIQLGIPPRIGLVRKESSVFLNKKFYHYIDNCFEAKVPKTNENYIGLELEMFTNLDHNELAKKLIMFNNNINIKDDGSIEIDNELYDEQCDCGDDDCESEHRQTDWKPVELNILMTEKEYKDGMLFKICDILNSLDTRVNDTCGLHVHLDMRHRDEKKSFHNLTMCQDLLFGMVESHRKNNTYCRKVETNDLDLEVEEHYHAISGKYAYKKFQTIEVRIHHGSTNGRKISSWISLLLKIINYDGLINETTPAILERTFDIGA